MERKHRTVVDKYYGLEDEFREHSEDLYRQQTAQLDRRIGVLMQGEDDEFLDGVRDLEERRDLELTRLYVLYEYLTGEANNLYYEEVEKIDSQHSSATKATHDRVIHKLESSLKRFRDDRSLVDISGDGGLEVGNLSLPALKAGNGTSNGPGKKRRRQVANYDTGGGSSDSQLSEFPRASNTELANSVASFLGDMDGGEVSSFDNPSTITSGRNKQALKYLTSLKSDEMNQDIELIRRAARK